METGQHQYGNPGTVAPGARQCHQTRRIGQVEVKADKPGVMGANGLGNMPGIMQGPQFQRTVALVSQRDSGRLPQVYPQTAGTIGTR